jgi:hypothetical protein
VYLEVRRVLVEFALLWNKTRKTVSQGGFDSKVELAGIGNLGKNTVRFVVELFVDARFIANERLYVAISICWMQ